MARREVFGCGAPLKSSITGAELANNAHLDLLLQPCGLDGDWGMGLQELDDPPAHPVRCLLRDGNVVVLAAFQTFLEVAGGGVAWAVSAPGMITAGTLRAMSS